MQGSITDIEHKSGERTHPYASYPEMAGMAGPTARLSSGENDDGDALPTKAAADDTITTGLAFMYKLCLGIFVYMTGAFALLTYAQVFYGVFVVWPNRTWWTILMSLTSEAGVIALAGHVVLWFLLVVGAAVLVIEFFLHARSSKARPMWLYLICAIHVVAVLATSRPIESAAFLVTHGVA
jgi:hypothetical protein